jgi:multiple sugar transport system substrate-binding protein
MSSATQRASAAKRGGVTRRSHWGVRTGAVATAAIAAVAMTGCGSSGTKSSSSSPTTTANKAAAPTGVAAGTISWWASPITTSGPDTRTVLINAFEKANPKIKVKLISAPTSTNTNQAALSTQITGGGGPDVFMGDVTWPAQFAAHDLATPLSNYLPSSYFSTFAPGLVAGATYQGKVVSAPFFEDQGFLYYRKDLLTKDNLPVPTTWAQVISDSKTIQGKAQTPYGYVFQGANYEGATCNFMEFLGDAGGAVLNSSGTKSVLTANGDAVKALSEMKLLVTSGVSPKGESTFQEANAMDAFAAGQSAFMRNWDYGYSTSQAAGSKVIGKVGVAPMPTFSGSGPGYSNIGGWDLYINPHTKNAAADVAFIKWMTGTQAQTILATQFSEIPTNESVRTSAKVVASNPVLAVVPKTKLIPRPTGTPQYAKVSQALYNNISSVLAGNEAPTAAINNANSTINTALSGGGL